MKHFAVLAFAALVACVALADAQSHNVQFGQVGPGDVLLHREIVTKKSKLLRVVTQDIKYPAQGEAQGRIITAIKCTDQEQKGKGGFASLTAGGPGLRDVTIHLKSQRGKGLNFLVEIYGR